MTTKIEIQLSDADMSRLKVVAAHQGKDVAAVANLALRLYLSRFDDLMSDNKEKEGLYNGDNN